ncbi:MAG: ABC transporter ATP-binding protein [Proteobacteria bacterium]|jgi:ABC-type multidrug transport system ATPase subunit|nr:ABC transporter ATP-binding protein [Pseudomonadota bacterium]
MIGIEFQDVGFAYIHQSIFKNLNAKFSAGEKIQLTGDNGAGKTTLLKLLCSLLKPQSGDIRYFDANYDMETNAVRKASGISLDDTHLLRNFTVVENLQLYQKLYGQPASFEKIMIWLDKFSLQTYRETPVQHLSQGEQKKVSIIKALLHDPQLLILDEPTNSLDQESKKNLSETLAALSSDRLVIVSTHDHEWAKTWSNRGVEIKGGKIL